MDLKGQKMLKVCSILMIVFGIIGAVFAVLILTGTIALNAVNGGLGLLVFLSVLSVVAAGAEIAAGFVGKGAAKMPSVGKIKASLVLGLIVLLFSLAGSIYNFVYTAQLGESQLYNIIGLFTGAVIPALFLVGLIQYKNALVALLSGE